jgi:hypothetical protein
MRQAILAIVAAASIASAGCFEYGRKTTGPSSDLSELAGRWASGDLGAVVDGCGKFEWNVTQYSDTRAEGSFSAECEGNVKIDATARAELAGSIINWSANGNASAPSLPSCPISLTGTATVKGNTIEVPYSGNTCMGPVSGTEVLTKR